MFFGGLSEHCGVDDWPRDQNDSLNGFGVGRVDYRVSGDRHGAPPPHPFIFNYPPRAPPLPLPLPRASKDASGGAGGTQGGYQFKCPACAKFFVSAGSVADHYKNKQDAPHQEYRAEHGDTISGDENKISGAAAGASSSSSGASSKRPMPDSSAMDGDQVFDKGIALLHELRQILSLPRLETSIRDMLICEIVKLVKDAGGNGEYPYSGGYAVADHYENNQDAPHQAYRAKHGDALSGDENKISGAAAGASSSSSGAGRKRPIPDSSAPSKKRTLEDRHGHGLPPPFLGDYLPTSPGYSPTSPEYSPVFPSPPYSPMPYDPSLSFDENLERSFNENLKRRLSRFPSGRQV